MKETPGPGRVGSVLTCWLACRRRCANRPMTGARSASGMAHLGVGAFHRCHQAEYTDDLLARRFDRWGVVGINIREPALAGTLGGRTGSTRG